MEQKSNTFLETEKIGKLMRKYSIPCIISLLVRALYNIVDQIFIANASYLQALGKAVESTLISLPRDVVICPTINANLGLTCLNKSAIFKLFKQVWVCESADQGIIRRRNKRKGREAMGKYENDVKRLLELVGGKENIQAVSHCMTRMRFVLVDSKKANEEAIEELPSVKGTFTQAGQYQVIIGNDVAAFYNEFTANAGIEGVSKDAVKAAAKTNQNPIQKIMGTLGEIFAPLIRRSSAAVLSWVSEM